MLIHNSYQNCQLCPRNCQVDRTLTQRAKLGYCGESDRLRIATVEAHFGEEPPISGCNGSGTIFFSGCSLKCLYCQNYQISHRRLGTPVTVQQVVDKIMALVQDRQIHNVNFVTPDHFFPHTIEIVLLLRERNIHIPTVYNVSGYQRIESLRMIENVADIYLPDFKYSDSNLARKLSQCKDYPVIALDAITEMVRQKGFLNSFIEGVALDHNVATQGVLVRHLILPNLIKNSIDALTTLFVEFGPELPISLMSQYYPTKRFHMECLNRHVTDQEFDQVYQYAIALGFKNMFVQFPEPASSSRPFLPDFRRPHPFPGNM